MPETVRFGDLSRDVRVNLESMAAQIEKVSAAAQMAAAEWLAVVRQVAVSRALDDLEESVLVPERKVLYQFSARGHDVTQVLLGRLLTGARDGLGGYYRSRPPLLTLGLRSRRPWPPP
jgi:TPP-dependent pyruvate/acetoin dehydrogenase alpha subunit